MKQIPLTQGQVAIVDDDDYPRLSQFKWHLQPEKSDRETVFGKHVRRPNGKRSPTYRTMHAEIIGMMPEREIDHRNGDSLGQPKTKSASCNTTRAACVTNDRDEDSSTGYKGVNHNSSGGFEAIDND